MTTQLRTGTIPANYRFLGELANRLSGKGLHVRWSSDRGMWLRPSYGRRSILVSAEQVRDEWIFRWGNHRSRTAPVDQLTTVADRIHALLVGGRQ